MMNGFYRVFLYPWSSFEPVAGWVERLGNPTVGSRASTQPTIFITGGAAGNARDDSYV
jgi:hypothetical protein